MVTGFTGGRYFLLVFSGKISIEPGNNLPVDVENSTGFSSGSMSRHPSITNRFGGYRP